MGKDGINTYHMIVRQEAPRFPRQLAGFSLLSQQALDLCPRQWFLSTWAVSPTRLGGAARA